MHGTTPTPVAVKLGMGRGAMSQWKKGSIPNGDTLIKIADYFKVSIDYILEMTDDPTPPKQNTNPPVAMPNLGAQIITIGQGGELVTFNLPPKQVPKAKKLLEVLAEDDA